MIANLKLNEVHEFTTKDWETPDGDTIPGERKVRRYVGRDKRGGIPFLQVVTEDGKLHLIAIECLDAVVPCADAEFVHPQLRAGWRMPSPPAPGYNTPVAVHYVDGTVELDFLDKEAAMYAIDDDSLPDFDFPWPWVEGFSPGKGDWLAIGIEPHW